MLKKGFRITKKEDFDRVFRGGKALFFGEIACRFTPNSLPHLRLGFSLSKKHLPLAVDRNLLRRILSETFTSQEATWPASVDIVFFSTKKPAKIDTATFSPIVSKVIRQINTSQ